MKRRIIEEIKGFVADYQRHHEVETQWGEPLVGFAAAKDPLFQSLKEIVISSHTTPVELLAEAQSVIAYFIPFAQSITSSNSKERISSAEWATGYIETNRLISALNDHLQTFFAGHNHTVASIPATHNWIEDKLISNWSHRHIAYIAGLGRFGLNNMLITSKGCSGRVGSLITSIRLEPDLRPETECCLYKYDGSCKKCVRKCVNEALLENSFDRFKCYDMLLKNVEEHKSRGYADVCGKCLAVVPCSYADPVKVKQDALKRKSRKEAERSKRKN